MPGFSQLITAHAASALVLLVPLSVSTFCFENHGEGKEAQFAEECVGFDNDQSPYAR